MPQTEEYLNPPCMIWYKVMADAAPQKQAGYAYCYLEYEKYHLCSWSSSASNKRPTYVGLRLQSMWVRL